MAKTGFPPVPKVLLESLEASFPDTIPTAEISVEQLRLIQGNQQVIRFLRHQYEKQTKNILE